LPDVLNARAEAAQASFDPAVSHWRRNDRPHPVERGYRGRAIARYPNRATQRCGSTKRIDAFDRRTYRPSCPQPARSAIPGRRDSCRPMRQLAKLNPRFCRRYLYPEPGDKHPNGRLLTTESSAQQASAPGLPR
jgi:hypothetical protein